MVLSAPLRFCRGGLEQRAGGGGGNPGCHQLSARPTMRSSIAPLPETCCVRWSSFGLHRPAPSQTFHDRLVCHTLEADRIA